MTKSWTRIDITCGAQTADILAAEFAELFGVSVECIPDGIRIYLDSARFADERERLQNTVESVRSLAGEAEIGLTLSEIQRLPRVIAIAGGPAKYAAIRAALMGRLVTVLVTDRALALRLRSDRV